MGGFGVEVDLHAKFHPKIQIDLFRRFDRTSDRDGRTDGQTDRHTDGHTDTRPQLT